jgi:RNA polymerase sigma factor (sigma-70 family)
MRQSTEALRRPGSIDEALLNAVVANEPGAASRLVKHYTPSVRRTLVRLLGADQAVDELVHDVFMIALRRLDTVARPRALLAWIRQIAWFTARRHIRTRVRERARALETVLPALDHTPAADFEARESMIAAFRILGDMNAADRDALCQRLGEGLLLQEVAAASSVSLTTAKRRIQRGRSTFLRRAALEPSLSERCSRG